ncbi:hypothetical protein JCM16303_006376 [Sporobolomyces ruberrimus]
MAYEASPGTHHSDSTPLGRHGSTEYPDLLNDTTASPYFVEHQPAFHSYDTSGPAQPAFGSYSPLNPLNPAHLHHANPYSIPPSRSQQSAQLPALPPSLSGNDYDLDGLLRVLRLIETSIDRSNKCRSQGRLKPKERLAAIQELLVPIWPNLERVVRSNVLSRLSTTSIKMTKTLNEDLVGIPGQSQFKKFCEDREPSSHELLDMIRPRVPQEWKYRIPKLFFEAVLWEVVRAVGKAVKRTDALKEEILKSKIVLEWDDTQPRAQIAMIDHSWKLAWQVVNHRRRIYEIAKKNATARQKDRIKALEPMNRFWDRIKPTVESYGQVKERALLQSHAALDAFGFNNLDSSLTRQRSPSNSDRDLRASSPEGQFRDSARVSTSSDHHSPSQSRNAHTVDSRSGPREATDAIDPTISASQSPRVAPLRSTSPKAAVGTSQKHYTWSQMSAVLSSIETSFASRKREIDSDELSPGPRLQAIRQFLEPIWSTLKYGNQYNLLRSLLDVSRNMSKLLEEDRQESSELKPFTDFCEDTEPRLYDILAIAGIGVPKNGWVYPIPRFFFEAVVDEIVRVPVRKGTDTWKSPILASSIHKEWYQTNPRAQLALIVFTHRRAMEIAQIRKVAAPTSRSRQLRAKATDKEASKTERSPETESKSWVDLRPTIRQYKKIREDALAQLNLSAVPSFARAVPSHYGMVSPHEHSYPLDPAAEGMSGRAGQQTLDPKFFFDVIPTEYEILQIVATRISEDPWSLPIPEGFFEAALYDIVRLVGADGGAYRWKQGIIDSSFGRGWKGTEPRAQFAMVEYTHRQLGEMRQLRGEATRDRWVEYGLTAQDFENVRKDAEESPSRPHDNAESAHAGPRQPIGLFPLMNNGLGHIPAQDLGFNNQALEIPSIAPDHGRSLHFRTLVPRSAEPGGPGHFDPQLATSHFPPVSPFPAPSSDTTIQPSRQDCQWSRMAFVLTSIQRSFERCNGRFCQGQLKPKLRLHSIRSLLEPIWSGLDLETRLNVFNLLSKASDKMAETIEKKREEDPTKNYLKAFCDDKEPSSYEILERIKPSASRWEYPIPRYFFEASLYEIIRATGKRIRRMGGWMTGIMTSTIGEEWEGNLPRAQLAMIEDTRKRARRLLAHAAAI